MNIIKKILVAGVISLFLPASSFAEKVKIGVLNLMGNVFMKKCDDVFETSKKFINEYQLKEDYDILVIDFHGEITSEKKCNRTFFRW